MSQYSFQTATASIRNLFNCLPAQPEAMLSVDVDIEEMS